MKIGLVGLGRMGGNIALNILDKGHDLTVYNRNTEKIKAYVEKGAVGASSLKELIEKTPAPRAIWLMVTAGKAVDVIIDELIELLEPNDLIIDGGNSFYKDTIRRAKKLESEKIKFLDVGTSGGVDGARNGACFMIGGDRENFEKLKPLFKDLSVSNGYGYFGKSGSGHFVKMVHNGIEYGMMQAMAEGFEIIEKSSFDLSMKEVAKVWNNGSVIRSWLMELIEKAFISDESLSDYSGQVGLSGEGEWTVKTSKELNIPTPVIDASVDMRIKSKKEPRYQGKVLQALRFRFGGHLNT